MKPLNKPCYPLHMNKLVYAACLLGLALRAEAQITPPIPTLMPERMIAPKTEVGDMRTYTLAPNPASEYVDIDLSAAHSLSVELVIFNGRGEPIFKKSIEKGEGLYRLDLDSVQDGQYILTMRVEGQGTIGRKFFISRSGH